MSNTNNATNQIGLEKADMSEVIAKLNSLLSSYHMFYINVRGYHWNVKGEHFFTLHPKFEELYTSLQVEIDEIAERVLTLGKPPHSRFADYIQESGIKEIDTIGMKDLDMVEAILDDMAKLIELEREILDATADAGEQNRFNHRR